MLLPTFIAARPVFLGASGGHQSLCGQQEATPRWSHLPGGPWEPRHISTTGKELVSEAKLPSGPETHMLWNGNASCPPPQPWRERGAGFPVLLWEGARCAGCGRPAQSSSSSFTVTVGTLSWARKHSSKKLMMERYRCCLRGALWK